MTLYKLEDHIVAVSKRTGGALRSRFGIWGIAIISFLESALPVPLITDPFLVAYILANKASALKGVVVTLTASLIGGTLAYLAAVGFFELLVAPYISEIAEIQFHGYVAQFREGTFLLSFIGALTPVPYTLVALAAGFVKGSLFLFLLASFLGRGLRYGMVGWLTYRYGERALLIARKQIFIATIFCGIVAIVYLYVKFF